MSRGPEASTRTAARGERDEDAELSTGRATAPEPRVETVARAPAVARDDGDAAPLGKLGRYQLLFEIARGGMGTVYAARLSGAHGFDRLVAIKRLRASEATEADHHALLAEARLTARISHPNVVQTIELGEEAGAPFLVMPLIEGVSLARLLKRLGERGERLDPLLAAWIAMQAALGLHAAHELARDDGAPLGLVHRDVSPENLLLSFAGRVHVADFGIAKIVDADRATKKGVLKGKFAYMSPEHVRGEPLDRRADVFALGIVLYESLVLRRLFAGASAADTIRRVLDEHPDDPTREREDVPASIAAVALRCLAKDRDARYRTAAEVADALRAALREGGRAVDEADLAALLDRVAAHEKTSQHDQLRAAIAHDGAARAPAPAPKAGLTTEASVVAPVTVGSSIGKAERPARPRVLLLGAGAIAAAIGVAIGATLVRGEPSSSAAASTAPRGAPSASGLATATTPLEVAAPSADVSAAPSATVVESSTSAHGPTARATVHPPAVTLSPSTPSTPARQAPSATANASVKGVPFDKLGP